MRHPIFAATAAAAIFAVAGASAQSAAESSIPDFSGYWQKGGEYASTFESPDSGPGPVVDPHPHPTGGIPWVGDYTNPILKPKAAAAVKATGDHILAGGEDLPAYSLCWPSGVPQVLNLREPVEFLQTPTEITILYQRDHQMRRVYLNVPHSKDPPKTWYGESVGHYEGDTLVVDTIGVLAESLIAVSEAVGLPNDGDMHIVERIHLAGPGTLDDDLEITAPHVLQGPWRTTRVFHRNRADPDIVEGVCMQGAFSEGKDAAGNAVFTPLPHDKGIPVAPGR